LFKLFNKYEIKFGVAGSQRATHPSVTDKRKQAWSKAFGSPGSGVVGPSPVPMSTSSSTPRSVATPDVYELSVYLDSYSVFPMGMSSTSFISSMSAN
jgi:hypothetical protein